MGKSQAESETQRDRTTQQDRTEPQADTKQLWKLAAETGPVIVFFVVNSYTKDIFWATGTFMVATVVSLFASRLLFGRVPVMPLVSGVFILLFGALTLVFQEEAFIKIKPTVVNLMFAAILFGGLFMGHLLIKYLLGEIYKLHDEGWRLLTYRWASFFVFLALLNEFVWRTFSTDFWIGFKIWGVMPITMAFALAQIGLLKRYDISGADRRSAIDA